MRSRANRANCEGGKIPTANFGYLRPASQKAAATAATIAAVPTSECVTVRWPRKNAPAPPSRVTQSTSAIRPETSSIGVAARVILFSPARPRAMEVSACVTGSMVCVNRLRRIEDGRVTTDRSNAVGILHRIGHGEGESVGHDPEFGGETPGGLSIHLNQDWDALFDAHRRRVGLEESHVSRAAQFPRPDQRQVGDVAPGAARGDEREFEFAAAAGRLRW